MSTTVTLADHSKVDLKKLLSGIASKAGLKKCPHIVLEDGVEAHTRFKKIRIGRDLPSYLEKDEMKGAIAHEVRHVAAKSFDIETVTWILYLAVASAFMYIFNIVETPEILLIAILFFPYSLSIRRYMSKKAEFEADRFAKSIVGVKPFSSALKKYYRLRRRRSLLSKFLEILSPHPALKDRLSRIADDS